MVTDEQIRGWLARDFHADIPCPLTTGIFIRIAAEAAEEDLRKGKKQITPYLCVIKKDGRLNPKFPGGIEAQATRLEGEGHIIIKGDGKKRPQVKDFEKYLQNLY